MYLIVKIHIFSLCLLKSLEIVINSVSISLLSTQITESILISQQKKSNFLREMVDFMSAKVQKISL